jgi:hypothetical protein
MDDEGPSPKVLSPGYSLSMRLWDREVLATTATLSLIEFDGTGRWKVVGLLGSSGESVYGVRVKKNGGFWVDLRALST